MVKKRGKKNRGGGGGKILLESAVDSDPEMGTGKKFQSWMNPMDEAEDQEERQLQKKLQRKNPRGKRADDANAREMFAISDSDSEYEVPTMKSIIKKRKEEEEVEEEAKAFSDSDIDDGQGHGGGTNPEDVIGGDAWGKRKKYFYGGNPNDPHFKDKNRVDDDSDLDEAELEAKESQKLQMKQMEQLDDDDFFDTFAEKPQKSKKKKIGKDQQEKILLDVSKLSKREKMKLFAQESPEFEGIVGDFDEKMEEARKLQPVVAMITDGKIPAGPAADLIKTKYQIILK